MHANEVRLRFQPAEILSEDTHMTDGQYIFSTIISGPVLLVILQFLKRRLLQNEPPGELYEDIAWPSVTSAGHRKLS
jgi:hypothetical protein